MNYSDLLNGLWEFGGALFALVNIRRLYKDKLVRGISVFATAYFTGWGVWNVFFYPINGLMWSFWGGLLLMASNLFWVGQMVYYKIQENKDWGNDTKKYYVNKYFWGIH